MTLLTHKKGQESEDRSLVSDRTASEVVHLSEFSLGSRALKMSDPFSEMGVEEGRRDILLECEDGHTVRYNPNRLPNPHIPVSREVIVA